MNLNLTPRDRMDLGMALVSRREEIKEMIDNGCFDNNDSLTKLYNDELARVKALIKRIEVA